MKNTLYNTLINNIAKTVKKSINEAFDFNQIKISKKELLKKGFDNIDNQLQNGLQSVFGDSYKTFAKIDNILQSMNINIPRGAKIGKDQNGTNVLWYGSMNKTMVRQHAYGMPVPIETFMKILEKQYGWKDEWKLSTEEIEKYCGQSLSNIDYYRLLLSPDNGLLMKIYNARKFKSPESTEDHIIIYDYGWTIEATGAVIYKTRENIQKKTKINLNSKGQPIKKYTKEEAQQLYNEDQDLCMEIYKYEDPYWTAWRENYNMLEDKYKPYAKNKQYDHPDRETFEKALDAWEKENRKAFNMDSDEIKKMRDHEKQIKEEMYDSLSPSECKRAKGGKYHVRYYFRKKWIDNK